LSDKLDRVIHAEIAFEKFVGSGKHDRTNKALFALTKAVREANLLPKEPVFVVRAKDRASVRTIGAWLHFAEREGSPPNTLNEVRKKLQVFEDWQNDLANSHHVKVPD